MARKSRSRRSTSSPATSTSTQLQTSRRSLLHAPLEAELVAAILAQMPLCSLAKEESSREVIIARYLDSLKRLDVHRQELLALGESIATASIHFESSPAEDIRAEIEQFITADFRIGLDASVNLAGAELGALPAAEVHEHLSTALTAACQKLIGQFLDGLISLMDRQLLGTAHWPGQNAVKYRFYRHRVRVQEAVTRTTITPLPNNPPGVWQWRQDESRALHLKVRSTPVEISIDCHQHDVINAFQTSIENSKVVTPPEVRGLLRTIPSWMRPSIRIIDGHLIRERINLQKQTHTSVVTDIEEEVVTTYIPHFDPAVLLGTIVLAGWGPKEIEQTKTVLRQQAIQTESGPASKFWLVCSLALQVPTACFLAGPGAVPRSFLLAAMLFIGSVFCLAMALHNFLQHKATPVKESQFQALMAGPVVALFGLLIALLGIGGFWMFLGLFIVGAGVALTLKIFSHNLPTFRF